MTALLAVVRERIRTGGPLTFAEYQNLALYHPEHGYYATGRPRTGWHGHFATSPEVGPAFGRLWAKAFEDIWEACGRPSQFDVVEIGPGEGGLAAAVVEASAGAFRDALAYRLIERTPELVTRQMERLSISDNVSWASSLDEASPVSPGCVVANEVLDNLAVHLVEGTDEGIVELFVEVSDDTLVLQPGPPSTPLVERYLETSGIDLPTSHRMEVGLEAVELARRAATVVRKGAVVFVDYGGDAAELARRPAGTLVAYSGAGVDDLVLERPGDKDLTSHVNWTAITRALIDAGMRVEGPKPQHGVLRALGLAALDQRLKQEHQEALAEGRGSDAVRALSERHGLRILSDPSGLGGLDVVVGLEGIPAPAFVSQ
jgi:SAM-dependent MidA family methyltransferase